MTAEPFFDDGDHTVTATVADDTVTIDIVTHTRTEPVTRSTTASLRVLLGALAHGFDVIPDAPFAEPDELSHDDDTVYVIHDEFAVAAYLPRPDAQYRGTDIVVTPTNAQARVVLSIHDNRFLTDVAVPATSFLAALGVGFIDVSGNLTRHLSPALPPFIVYPDRSTRLLEEVTA